MKRPIVAIMYDFDKTLCTKDMQEYGFISSLGMTAEEFWKESNKMSDEQEMDNVLAYMFNMVEKAKEAKVRITRQSFQDLGKEVKFFDGVEGWFDRITKFGEKVGVKVEHYIVSSGVKEIIEGTSISSCFKKIYACEFFYDYNGTIVWPKCDVNYTTKTQFLFRINKGVLTVDSGSAKKLNQYTPEYERRVPFRNMIYIGDGLTDVPCMKLVKNNGGQSIAVYDEEKGKQAALQLKRDGRVNYVLAADYTKDGELDTVVKAIMKKIYYVEKMRSYECP